MNKMTMTFAAGLLCIAFGASSVNAKPNAGEGPCNAGQKPPCKGGISVGIADTGAASAAVAGKAAAAIPKAAPKYTAGKKTAVSANVLPGVQAKGSTLGSGAGIFNPPSAEAQVCNPPSIESCHFPNGNVAPCRVCMRWEAEKGASTHFN